jgi:hypothetical protein
MDQLDIMWRYEGYGPVLMGYISPRIMRDDLLQAVAKQSLATGDETLSYSASLEIVEMMKPDRGNDVVLDALHVTRDKGLSAASITALTIAEFKALAFLIDAPHDAIDDPAHLIGFDEYDPDAWHEPPLQ